MPACSSFGVMAPGARKRRIPDSSRDDSESSGRPIALGRAELFSPPLLLRLQRTAGNAAVSTLLGPRQALVVQRDGERSDAGVAQDSGSVSASSACQPTPLSRQNFLQQAGANATELGLTTLDLSQVTYPEAVRNARGGIQSTTAALPAISSISVGAGVFMDPQDTVRVYGQPGSGCPTGDYPRRWTITSDGADRIRLGEQEHCDDFRFAFDISLRRYADAVNRLAAGGRRFPSDAAMNGTLRAIVGVAPDDWTTVFMCLAGRTRDRDGARNRWHTPRARSIDPYPHCRYVTMIIDGNSLPQVGAHPSSSIIHGCGERPVRTPRR